MNRRVDPPLEPIGQSAILYVRPNALRLHNQYIHPFRYGNQNQMAQAVLFVQNGTLGRACGAVEK